jgi:AraC family transcriptional activator of mtrCDE
MPAQLDWLSQFLQLITVTGKLELRCIYGVPWQVVYEQSPARQMPYHVVLKGMAILEDPGKKTTRELVPGDIAVLSHGSAHVLHDGSGRVPAMSFAHPGLNFIHSRNESTGEDLDMLCGRFYIAPPHDRLIGGYLPSELVVRMSTGPEGGEGSHGESAADQLARLVAFMRIESAVDRLGGYAMLNALSAALFTLTLRAASESTQAPVGLLALAGHPRLAPALSAMLDDPAKPWTLPELARLCSMSRATFTRHFLDKLGRSAYELLTDIRMGIAANALKTPSATTERVAEIAGYQSVAAFRRTFTQWMGMTPGEWRAAAVNPGAVPGPGD